MIKLSYRVSNLQIKQFETLTFCKGPQETVISRATRSLEYENSELARVEDTSSLGASDSFLLFLELLLWCDGDYDDAHGSCSMRRPTKGALSARPSIINRNFIMSLL